MKRLFIFLGLLAIGATVGAVSEPSRQDFLDALGEKAAEFSTMNLFTTDSDGQMQINEKAFSKIHEASGTAKVLINSNLEVKDYGIFNIASFDGPEGRTNVGIGFMGHVFTLSHNLSKKLRPIIEPYFDQITSGTTEMQPYLEDIFK